MAEKDNMATARDLPPVSFDHIARLTDRTGILQHATFAIPNRHEGYCLDDNARALLLMAMTCRHAPNAFAQEQIPVYLSYIHHAQNPDGTFRNFMGFDRVFLDETGTDDAFGRAIWALGYTAAHYPGRAFCPLAWQLIQNAMPRFAAIRSVRAIAAIILGLCHCLEAEPQHDEIKAQLTMLSQRLQFEYDAHRTDDWHWYERLLAYDNGLLPLAMLCASNASGDERMRAIAFESLSFLEKHTTRNGRISLIGNAGWYPQGSTPAQFDQQPVDAMTLVLLYRQAYADTGEQHYADLMRQAFYWFLGDNDVGLPLYDPETQGCSDGLQDQSVNLNQGAESTLAFWISRVALEFDADSR